MALLPIAFSWRSLAGSCLAASFALPAAAQCGLQFLPSDPVSRPTGTLNAMRVWDPDGSGPAPELIVAGGQVAFGNVTGASVVAYDGAEWQVLGTPPAGTCTALFVFGGELIAALSRSSIASDLAAWNGSSWRTIGVVRGVVETMGVYAGNLFVGGTFSHVDGLPAASIAQWDGTVWASVGVAAGGVSGTVRSLAAFSGVLYVGGDITQASGIPVGNLAIWNGSTWVAGPSFNGGIDALAVRVTTAVTTSYLFVGGRFTTVGGLAIGGLARFNSINGWSALAAPLPGSCASILVRATGLSSYELTVGVNATNSATSSIYRLIGSTWVPVGNRGGIFSRSLLLSAGRLVVACSLGVLALDTAGEWLPLSGTGIDGRVIAMRATATDMVIGGEFTTISRVRMNGIARGSTGAWQPLGAGMDGAVTHLATLPSGDVIAAGLFTSAGGVSANRIARWNGNAWSALGSGIVGVVSAMSVLPNGDLVVAGITQAGGQSVNRIARWNGSAWSSLGSGLAGDVWAMATRSTGEILVSYVDATVRVQPVIGRWNGTSWGLLADQPNGAATAIGVLANDDVLFGGTFSSVGSLTSAHVARWNGSTWSAVPGFTHAIFSSVHDIVPLPNGEALVLGYSVGAGGASFARYDGQAVVPLPPASFLGGDVAPDGVIYLTAPTGSGGRLASNCPARATGYGSGCAGSGGLNTLSATSLPWTGTRFGSEVSGLPTLGLALSVTGLAQTSIPIHTFLRQGLPGCSLLATPDLITTLTPRAGRAQSSLQIPAEPSLANQVLHQQVFALELDGANNLIAATTSNGLRLTIGMF